MAPAPAKNPNATNKMSSNSIPNNNSSHYAANNGGSGRKTGTVPKTTTATKSTSTSHSVSTETTVGGAQHGQKSILQPSAMTQLVANRCSPLNIVASIQQQQQQTRSHHPQQQQQQYKNTEIVAPIRRELKDLNDYLLTTVVTTANNTNSNQPLLQQQQSIGAGSTNSDLENSQENQQRFCYPVRPIPRRNQPQSQHQTQQSQNDYLNATTNTGNANLNTTIGVVIPTTPGLPASNNAAITSVQPNNSNPNATGNTTSQLPDNPSVLGPQFEQQIQLLVLQRLRQLFENSQTSPFLNLTTSLLPGIQASSSASLSNTILNHNSNEITQLAQRFQNLNNNNPKSNLENSNSLRSQPKRVKAETAMVHEINTSTSNQNEVVVNSTSLEDVPLSEHLSDRAQSIQSLHSNIETPTPDTTPSYEELQQRLEASNRNIHNMQEQQQQLLKLQNAAKQHLSDMEKLRQQAGTLSFPCGSQRATDGGDGAPEYQSIDQVHSDMATLVGRMKNLTSFIHNQNELSTLLGDDGPEILAEQEVLQRKLESLRTQRDEMRNLVSELQSVNRSAEETAKEARQRQFEQEKDIEENDQEHAVVPAKSKKASNVERDVPEFTRNVPIELLEKAQRPQPQRPQTNGNEHSETETDMDEDERKETAELIQQKVADIEAMKAQLKRLKDMMETVNLIEAHTGKDPKLVGRTPPREVPIIYDRERTPVASAMPVRYSDDNGNEEEEFITRKVRMLNEVTSDLRAQAESLQAEKDRIQLLKAEIERRKNQAAAAVQMGDDALKRNSLTPTPVPRSHEERWEEHLKTQHERDQLKEEYERKKKEFEVICKRLEQEDEPNQQAPRTRRDIVSEADDEAEEDNIESDYAESAKFVPTSTPATSRNNENNSRARTGKDSLNSTGVSSNTGTHIAQAASSTHDGASLEAASLQSGSSRSFSIPPPMSAMGINFPGPIPPPLPTAWNPHQYYYATGGVPPPPPPPQAAYGLTPASLSTAPLSNSECICTANNLGAATSSSTATSAAATNNASLAADPMLQQFIQTQQMLINSVCQCNQMLWHQQREIDSLNQTITFLAERIISLGGAPNVSNPDVGYSLRSESVPPPSLGGIPPTHTHALPNNLYMSMNRAQSEQPAALYIAPGHTRNGGAFANYHQQQHHLYRRISQQQPLNAVPQAGAYNFSTETQQHNSSSTASASMYSTLNNAVPPPPAPTTLFNNEIPPTPQSPVVGSGPAPIFMHHHNNSIHQNNANLRTQNQQQQHQHHSNVSGSTLNNQVPPGNRANNYWDNFRSYSRQNLLSTNYSTKSNEEQQQMLQQQQQQQQQHNQPEAASYERPQSMPQHPTQQQIYHEQNLNLDDCVNNLNYAATPPNNEAVCNTSASGPTNNTTSAADVMYHNYNIQQSNKVGPKPNWRFRNLNEDYPSINRLQQQRQQASLQRYQNTSFAQQQPPLGTPQFLNYLPQSQSATRNHDFLLRPSLDINEDDVNYDFSTNTTTIHNQNIVPPEYNENNEDEDEEEEDDTTSEEIKRNLLVNALKNDKFTTKFYESIKEDVFRRLESMLLDKDNVAQASAGTACVISQQPQPFNNNISHTPRNDYATVNDDNADNENEKPEEDTNWRQNNMNNCSASSTPSQTCSAVAAATPTTTTKNCSKKRKNVRKQSLSNNNNTSTTTTTTMVVPKEDEHNENIRGACSLAAQHHQKLQQENKDKQNENKNPNAETPSAATTIPSLANATASPQTKECDLIQYIISRIRNQTHANTLINDALLVEVAKLTATTVSHAQPLTQNNSSNNISPKKIYTKIKKLTIPKDRDEFLSWYQQYLENTLFSSQAETKTSKSSSAAKSPNNQQQTTQQNGIPPPSVTQQPTQQDDGDLAEADQNCSSNTSGNGNYHHQEDGDSTNVLNITTKVEVVDDTQDPLEGACALVTSSSLNQVEDVTGSTCEKNDLKTEKQDYNEKE